VALGSGLVRERRRALPTTELERLGGRLVAEDRARVSALVGRLDAMSPVAVLARGYAIVTRRDGHAVRAASEVSPGERLHVRVARGTFAADVRGGVDAAAKSEPEPEPGSEVPREARPRPRR
jgi:exodeoxyribonuclease VII large subunit